MTGIEKALGIKFKKKLLLTSALTHPSFHDPKEAGGLYFQRLEFLGDSVINSFVAFELYCLFPKANEGMLTRFRSLLVSRKTLSEIAARLKLGKFIRVGRQEEQKLNLMEDKILADTFEALVAAIYLDCGQKKVERFLKLRFAPSLKKKNLFQFSSHPKSMLQEYTQKKSGSLPQYETAFNLRKEIFEAHAAVSKRNKAKGTGRTKQEAEANAAAALILKLKIKSGG